MSAWDDLQIRADGAKPGRYCATISDPWMLAVVPQGGIAAALAVEAMADTLGDATQTPRTLTAVFAGKVDAGPVEIDVQVLRRGRSMSQLTATVRNPGQEAGLTAIAAFGAPRRGFSFTDLQMPAVDGPEGRRSFRDPLPDGVEFEFTRPPMPFWEEIVEARPVIGRPPWEPFEDGPAETASWYRIDDPPVLPDGTLHPAALIVVCDTMPGAVGQKLGPDAGPWFGPSVDLTVHLLEPAPAGWLLAHNRARHAGDGYASVDQSLWTADGRLVAYATQLMFFAFGV
jgi:acyl-CoA thioesterase